VFFATSRNRVAAFARWPWTKACTASSPSALQPVEAPGALSTLSDEAGLPEQPEVRRHRGPADRHRLGDPADGEVLGTEEAEYLGVFLGYAAAALVAGALALRQRDA
jgi:hypothetical protein